MSSRCDALSRRAPWLVGVCLGLLGGCIMRFEHVDACADIEYDPDPPAPDGMDCDALELDGTPCENACRKRSCCFADGWLEGCLCYCSDPGLQSPGCQAAQEALDVCEAAATCAELQALKPVESYTCSDELMAWWACE